jgi:hypothetical protein
VNVPLLPYWLTHLAGCPQLQELHIGTSGHKKYAQSHPALVTTAAVQHVPSLVSLCLTETWYCQPEDVVWTAHPPLLPAPAGAGAPLLWQPQGALRGLTALQQLQANPCAPLVLSTAGDWEALACLSCLSLLEVSGLGVWGAGDTGRCVVASVEALCSAGLQGRAR